MTNLDLIKDMKPEQLAVLLIHDEPEMKTSDPSSVTFVDRFYSPCSSSGFADFDNCLTETIKWLKEESGRIENYD